MKIHVSRIPDTGVQETATYDPHGMDMDRDDVRVTGPFTADLLITKSDEELVVAAQIHCLTTMVCARCLKEFPANITPREIFSYTVKPTDVVDVTDDVRQEVLLAYPITALCRSDCKGICETCGAELNATTCPHHAASAA